MADPATAKVTLVTLLGATAVGAAAELLVEWMGILLGAGVGGLIACSMARELNGSPLWPRVKHWGLAALVGAVAAPVALIVLNKIMGPLEHGAGMAMLPFVSMVAAGFWLQAARLVPKWLEKWQSKP